MNAHVELMYATWEKPSGGTWGGWVWRVITDDYATVVKDGSGSDYYMALEGGNEALRQHRHAHWAEPKEQE